MSEQINNMCFQKLNILITGGSKGIGKNIAINFLNCGHNVIVTYNNSYKEAVELKEHGIFIYKLDITNKDECTTVLREIIDSFTKIDVLINNAGIIKNALFHKMTFDDWSNVINTNLTSIYNVTHPVINNMIKYYDGKIINISSIYLFN
jgi:NADP-dependent 3-hydroxy acid dehydrogenase YdfG